MKTFLMLHGINHNMFGKRDPVQYGTITLSEIDDHLKKLGGEVDAEAPRKAVILDGGDRADAVDMALDDMAA